MEDGIGGPEESEESDDVAFGPGQMKDSMGDAADVNSVEKQEEDGIEFRKPGTSDKKFRSVGTQVGNSKPPADY